MGTILVYSRLGEMIVLNRGTFIQLEARQPLLHLGGRTVVADASSVR